MRKKGRDAAEWMRLASKAGMTGVQGWCLRTCRNAWSLPADNPSAILEWKSIPAEKKNNKWWLAPVGAPHFWEGGEFGHVAIQSGLKGYVWSTDAPVPDKIGRVSIFWFGKRWNYKYLGWSSEFQNKPLPSKVEKPVKPKKVK